MADRWLESRVPLGFQADHEPQPIFIQITGLPLTAGTGLTSS